MVVSDLEGQRRLLVDVVGLQVVREEGEYVRIGGQGGFHLGLEEGPHASPCDGLEVNIQVDDVVRYIDVWWKLGSPSRPSGATGVGGRYVWFRDVDGHRMSRVRLSLS